MIVKMKKVTVLAPCREKDAILHSLADSGVVHLISYSGVVGEELQALLAKKALIREVLGEIPKGYDDKPRLAQQTEEAVSFSVVQNFLETRKEYDQLKKDLIVLTNEAARIEPWGNFRPEDIEALAEKGAVIRFYVADQAAFLSCREQTVVISSQELGDKIVFAALSHKNEPALPFEAYPLPQKSLEAVRGEIKVLQQALFRKEEWLQHAYAESHRFQALAEVIEGEIQFETAKTAFKKAGPVAYVTGYCPEYQTNKLQERLSSSGWYVLIEDPGANESVPTLIKNNAIARLFQPLIKFLDVFPGYRETDANGMFLVFFTVFFALLIGDAGYGLCLFLTTFFFHRWKKKLIAKETIFLFYLLSFATTVWGAMSGLWFGAEQLSRLPVFQSLVVPKLYAFSQESEANVVALCFGIGAFQLALAHLWNGMRFFPALRTLAEAGWIFTIFGLYLLVRAIILAASYSPYLTPAIGVGILLVVLFSEQREKGIFTGIGQGLINLPSILLTGIGNFSDLVSYVRLFAVGLATKEIAVAFNKMALDIGMEQTSTLGIAIVILLFGHSVNLLLAAMSVLVHGVRLNFLEFSKHLNLEWSGFAYHPLQSNKRVTIKQT